MRRGDASTVVESIRHALTNYAAVGLGLRGQTMTLGSGCASGVDVIQWACAQRSTTKGSAAAPPHVD